MSRGVEMVDSLRDDDEPEAEDPTVGDDGGAEPEEDLDELKPEPPPIVKERDR
jgi:hypothetical protein